VEAIGLESTVDANDESEELELGLAIPAVSVSRGEDEPVVAAAISESSGVTKAEGLAARAEGRKGDERARRVKKMVVEGDVLNCIVKVIKKKLG
jgi:hypothetical protein